MLKLALKAFNLLSARVNNDPMAQTSVEDLVSAATFELDLHYEGDQDPPLKSKQILELKHFVKRYSGKEYKF